MIRSGGLVALALGAGLWCAGCSTAAQFETRSYVLQQRATEEPLIKAILDDEAARIGGEALSAAVESYGGKVDVYTLTPDNTAIVRTTPRAHAAIRKALDDRRKDAAAVPSGT